MFRLPKMILETKEAQCTIRVLSMLSNKKAKYNQMFRATKVSHTTLQRVLKELEEKKFIRKYDIGHMNVDYEITDKGRVLVESLQRVRQML